ncbi:queuosine 5'-phosphate N-glycosylase/hydrolase-like [Liolophura sinensis]|uniref:queuosine 5'-phosphate N-glycosylase/hydrolase-like n=1 Tax=Liolophura sinensis TaxID=3198878 RepID=UPI003158CE1F
MSEKVLFPREAGRFIAETSKDVEVKEEGVRKIAKLIIEYARQGKFRVDRWKDHELNPITQDKAAVDWIFVSDVLNFSFWADDDSKKYTVSYKGKPYTGYWSLCAAINRAVDEGYAITDPDFYASISKEDLQKIFRSDSSVDIPLLEQRHQVLCETGKVLLKKYDGSFVNCIRECNQSAEKLMRLIVENFPSMRDEAEYCGKKVALYKRAQILIADIWAACGGKGLGEFHDIDTITMFADYRIPQVLTYYGALKYSNSLQDKLQKDNILENGERQEVEIRGCSIWATELIVEEVKRLTAGDEQLKDLPCNAIMVDHYLWDHRREFQVDMESTPYHKTRSIYY